MAEATIYHNPRCTKSRQAMQVAADLGVELDVVRYLDAPPDAATLRAIIAKLDDPPADLVRRESGPSSGSRTPTSPTRMRSSPRCSPTPS